MTTLPENLSYTEEHEWVKVDEAANTAVVGVTAFATKQLGDIVLVDLPQVGDTITAGEPMGEIESTKSVSELYAPVTGEVVEVNQAVIETPETLNEDAYEAGWLLKVAVTELPDSLMSAEKYGELIGE